MPLWLPLGEGGGSVDNPLEDQANASLKRPRNPGDLHALQRKLWWALVRAEAVMDAEEATAEQRLRAIHALNQVAATYMNLLKTSDFEARLAKVEQALQRNGHGHP
jgi:hypothetical protein